MKYDIKKADYKAIFAAADSLLQGRYHSAYERLGLKLNSKSNTPCVNKKAHSSGRDANPSFSVDNETGQYNCFACHIKGNFHTYWKDYISNGSQNYAEFLVEFLKIDRQVVLSHKSDETDVDFDTNTEQLQDLYQKIQNKHLTTKGRPWILSGELSQMVREANRIPMKELDSMVAGLLGSKEDMDYLYQTRRITEDIIKTHKIGMIKKPDCRRFIFPIINAEGDFINAKAYNPTHSSKHLKWTHLYKGREFGPVPINNFTKQKIYFFEGEPDLYCALSFGVEGAVTMGANIKKDVNAVFGESRAKQLFLGKEIVIVFDSDEASKKPSFQLAESLYPYAKQVKIIDLNISDINPKGLNPKLTHISKEGGKEKRSEKDFTDFMKKNGFGEEAKKLFDKLVENTPVFTLNKSRSKTETYKVTIQESRQARYFSADRSKILEIVASVSEFKDEAYMYPTEFSLSCPVISDVGNAESMCGKCVVKKNIAEASGGAMKFRMVREVTKESIVDPKCVAVSDHNILGLVQVTDSQKQTNLKRLYGIPDRCKTCMFADSKTEKLLHVRLSKDINEYEKLGLSNNSEIQVEAYIKGDSDISQNQTYRFRAYQTTAWHAQHAVLFIDKAEPVETSIDSFEMDQDTHDLLQVFRQKDGETMSEHIKRRHKAYSEAAGVTSREDLFLINDLAFLSPIEIENKIIPEVKRGWVEVIIAGDPRTGKTLISEFLHKHYKIGKIIGGSSGVSRSGLIGGVKNVGKRSQISWGAFVKNDKGLVIVDEMSEIEKSVLTDLGDIRSKGIASVDMIVTGREVARTRKIFLSNSRGTEDDQKEYNYGIQFLKDLCLQPRTLARFDIGYIVKSGDVDIKNFKSNYSELTTEFNEYQCRHLIMWAYSRKPSDVIYEDGFDNLLDKLFKEISDKFDSETLLVNQEQRAKYIRLSISLASMMYSTPDDDWNKILVKKEHLQYIHDFLVRIYCGTNIRMDDYSKMIRGANKLGDMRFMENISKVIDITPLIVEAEFTEKAIQHIFYDYLHSVAHRGMYIPDAKSDYNLDTGLAIYESTPKLISILTSRNCLKRSRKGMFKKTPMFTRWLTDIERLGEDAKLSNILEPKQDESNSEIAENIQKGSIVNRNDKKRRAS